MYIFKGYHLKCFQICMYPEAIITVKIMNISNTTKYFRGTKEFIIINNLLIISLLFFLTSLQFLLTTLICFLSLQISLLFIPLNKQNHIICTLFYLTSFTEYNYFEIHLCYSMFQQFILFIAQQYSILWIYHNLFIHSHVDGLLGCHRLQWFPLYSYYI